MSGHLSFGRIELSPDARPVPASERSGGGPPFRIGVLGNFRGRTSGGGSARPIPVDRDRIEAVMSRLGVGLDLAWPGRPELSASLVFRSVDDFHPDQLLATEAFRPLCEARRKLSDPKKFRAAAEELGLLGPPKAEPVPVPSPPPPPPASQPPADLLDQILAQTPSSSSSSGGEDRAWRSYLDRITAAHVVPGRDPRQDELVAGVESALAERLREVLHHPDFQALESAWRGIDRLTRELETGESLTVELIDLPREALEADLVSGTPLERTATYRRLVDDTAAGDEPRPWSLLVGLYTFEAAERDVALLWRLGQVARLARAPFVAAAGSRFVGCDRLTETPDPDDWSTTPAVSGWVDLRHSDEAPYLGLALPRVIARWPYGSESHPVDAFAFEELPGTPAHEDYLWGSPALAVALLVGRAVSVAGRDWGQGYDPELGDLPTPLEESDGETAAKPCAEVLLGQRAVDRVLDAGLMPFVSLRNRDAVRLAQLRSVSDPPAALEIPGG